MHFVLMAVFALLVGGVLILEGLVVLLILRPFLEVCLVVSDGHVMKVDEGLILI